jgi:subtilisin family serine protease
VSSPRLTVRFTVLAAALSALGCADQSAVEPASSSFRLPNLSMAAVQGGPRRHLVVLRQERGPSAALLAAVQALGGQVERRRDAIGVLSVTGLTDGAAAALAARSDVDGAASDAVMQWIPPADAYAGMQVRGPVAQTDQSGAFFFGDQWNLRQINADDAWLETPQGAGATIAILDSGLDPGHLDLNGKVDVARSRSMLTPGSSPCNAILGLPDEQTIFDFNLHGSFVGAIAVANGFAMASVAPDATLIGVKVLNCTGSGSFDDVIAGIEYAAASGVDVINLSLGTLLPKADPTIRPLVTALQRAVLKAVSKGAVVIAASGNQGVNLDDGEFLHVPSQLLGVVSVGATAPVNQQNFDQIASYSNYGRVGVDLVAPGGDDVGGNPLDLILSVCSRFSVFFNCGGGAFYLIGSGTSFAAPHVSGTAAVVESATRGNSFGLLLETCLLRGTDRVDGLFFSPLYGLGRIDVVEAVNAFGCGGRKHPFS